MIISCFRTLKFPVTVTMSSLSSFVATAQASVQVPFSLDSEAVLSPAESHSKPLPLNPSSLAVEFRTLTEDSRTEIPDETAVDGGEASDAVVAEESNEALRDNSQVVRRMMEFEISSSMLHLPQSPEMMEGFLSRLDTQISPSGPTVIVWGSEESSSSFTAWEESFLTLSSILSILSACNTSDSDGEVDEAGYEADISSN